MIKPSDVLQGNNLFYPWEKIIGACVFTDNKDIADRLERMGVQVGGTGTGKDLVLPHEIEHIYPDYSLYGIKDTAYGFLSRGCPRQCPFCIVANKEGTKSVKVADLSEWWSGQKNIVLCDPNILACEQSLDLLQQLVDSKAHVDVNQGLDIRLINKENIEILNKMKVNALHFAWDNPKTDLRDKFYFYKEYGALNDHRKLRVYVLVNYWSTFEEDLKRVYWLRDNGYDPYVMIYDKKNAPKRIKRLGRWVNSKFIFRACEKFEDYI